MTLALPLRALFPATRGHVILDNAGEGPCALPVAEALSCHAREAATRPAAERDYAALAEEGYERASRVLRAPRRNLAFVHGTTSGFLFLSRSLPLEPSDVVLIPSNEYPATVLPWREREMQGGARVEMLSVPPTGGASVVTLERELLRPEVKVLCLSAVGWLGHRYPLPDIARLCQERGVLLAVDGSQAIGMIDMSLADIQLSFLATTFFKWAFGPEGIGCVYIHDDLRRRLRPVLVSTETAELDPACLLAHQLRLPLPPAPLVLGNPAPICLAGLIAGLDLVLEIGLDRIEPYILSLSGLAAHRLAGMGMVVGSAGDPASRSGIVTFSHKDAGRSVFLQRELAARRIFIHCREGLLRASFHIYNDASDVNRLCDALEALL